MVEREYQFQVDALIERAVLALKGGNPDAAFPLMRTAAELAEEHPAFAASAPDQLARIATLVVGLTSSPSCSIDVSFKAQQIKQRVTMLLRLALH